MLPLPIPEYFFRKAVHLALAAGVFFLPGSVILAGSVIGALLSLALPYVLWFRRFFYSGGDLGPLFYFLFVALAFASFPFHIAALAWITLAVGDAFAPVATLLPPGFTFRSTGKTFSGLLIYAATSFLAVIVVHPALTSGPFSTVDLLFASLAAALLDGQSRRPWDNLLPPLAAALILILP